MRIGYFGTPKHSCDLMRILLEAGHKIEFVVTNPDKPQGRKKVLTPSPVKEFALENNIPVIQPVRLKEESVIKEIQKYETDIHIVYAYGSIIPKPVFTAPKIGSVNLHGSILPEYRGASPVQTAILDGKTETGFSIQYVAESVDSGNVLSKGSFPINTEDNSLTVLDRITKEGSLALLHLLEEANSKGKLEKGEIQNESLVSYCQKITAEDRILDFSQSAFQVFNRVRALYPNPIAYTHFREKRLLILKVGPPQDWRNPSGNNSISIDLSDSILEKFRNSQPGEIVKLGKKSLFVICGDKKMISIEEIQPEGKKPMRAVDFLNGFTIKEGERFT